MHMHHWGHMVAKIWMGLQNRAHFLPNPFARIWFVLHSRDSPMSIVTANAYLIQTGGLHEACVGPATTMLTGNTCCVEQTKSEGTDGINRADGLGIRGNGLQNHAHGLKLFSFFLPCNPRGGPSFILCQFIL